MDLPVKRGPRQAIRPKVAFAQCGFSEPTGWRWVKTDPKFPRPRKLGPNITIFFQDEIDDYLAAAPVYLEAVVPAHPPTWPKRVPDVGGPPKRKPGRPRIHPLPQPAAPVAPAAPAPAAENVTPIKRGPGRPRKYPLPVAVPQTPEA